MGRNEKGLSESNLFREYFLTMIFVTVGTHEQQFDRLVKYMDDYANVEKQEVIIQTGYSTYQPNNCYWKPFFSYDEMNKCFNDANIIITHGGPSSFLSALQLGKIPIVVPRKKEYGEHVNDHQVLFCREINQRTNSVLLIENISEIKETIKNYNNIISRMKNDCIKIGNNEEFCEELEALINDLMK